MPLVKPQLDGFEEVADVIERNSNRIGKEEADRIIHFLNVKPWGCIACGARVFGRSLKCACGNARPTNFVLEPR